MENKGKGCEGKVEEVREAEAGEIGEGETRSKI